MMGLRVLKVLKRQRRKVSKSKEHEYNSPQCFHWGHSIDIKEEQKKEEQNNDEPPTLTKEEEEKFLKYKEKKSMLNQKRSRPLKKVVERNEDVFKKKEKIPKKESLRSNQYE